MPDQSEPKAARTSSTQQEPQTGPDETQPDIAAEIIKNLKRWRDGQEHLRAEVVVAHIEALREALHSVRRVACEALADAAPERTIMVVMEEGHGDIIATCPVSDVVASDRDKTRSIHEFSEQCGMSVDFVRVQGKTLSSSEACKKFLRHLNGDDDSPFTI